MLFSPSVDVIERTLAEATTLADRVVFSALTARLEEQQKAAPDSLLVSEGEQPSRQAERLQQTGKLRGRVSILPPLMHSHINMLGHYTFTLPEDIMKGELRPLNFNLNN